VTDTAGNTYHRLGQIQITGVCLLAFLAKDIVANASNVLTMTWGASPIFSYLNALEFSGIDLTAPRDASQVWLAGTNTLTMPAYSTFYADEVITMGCQVSATGSTWTAGSGFTIPSGATPTDNVLTGQYQIVSSLQTNVTTTQIVNNSGTAANECVLVSLVKAITSGAGAVRLRFYTQ
jgi:hypothetical protein